MESVIKSDVQSLLCQAGMQNIFTCIENWSGRQVLPLDLRFPKPACKAVIPRPENCWWTRPVLPRLNDACKAPVFADSLLAQLNWLGWLDSHQQALKRHINSVLRLLFRHIRINQSAHQLFGWNRTNVLGFAPNVLPLHHKQLRGIELYFLAPGLVFDLLV